MKELVLASVRQRWTSLIGSFIAVGLAAAMISGCAFILTSALLSQPAAKGTALYSAATAVVVARPQITISTPNGRAQVALGQRAQLPDSLVPRIQGIPGVRSAVGAISFTAQPLTAANAPLTGADGTLVQGHAWSSAALAPFSVRTGRAPAASDEVAMDADLARRGGFRAGDQVRVITPSGTRTFVLTGVVAPSGRDALPGEPALFFASATAPELAGTSGTAGAIAVVGDGRVSAHDLIQRIDSTLHRGDLQVQAPRDVRNPLSPDANLIPLIATAFAAQLGGVSAFVAAFVVASTFAFAILQRHRELALLRAIGTTPQQVRLLVAGEALVISVVASTIGAVAGIFVAELLVKGLALVGIGGSSFTLVIGGPFGPLPLLAAIVFGVGLAEIGVLSAASRAARVEPVEALREAALADREIGTVRRVFGYASLAFGVLLVVAGIVVGQILGDLPGLIGPLVAVFALSAGAALLIPILVRPLVARLSPYIEGVSRATGFLALATVAANPRRVASAAAPVVLTVTLTCTLVFVTPTIRQIGGELTARHLQAQFLLLPKGPGQVPSSMAADAARLPGVAAAASARSTQVIAVPPPNSSTQYLYNAEAVDQDQIPRVLHLDVKSGSLSDLHGDAIAVSFLQSLTMAWHVGDHVQIWLADGTPVTVRVAAIYAEDLALPAANYFILPLQLVAAHSSQQLDDVVYLATSPGADPAQVAKELRTLNRDYPTVEIQDKATFLQAASTQTLQNYIALLLFLGLAVIYTAISVVNTFVMSTAERGREFALLRVVGATTSQVLRMIGWETVLIISLGVGLGLAITAVGLVGMSLAMVARVEIVIDPRALGIIVLACVVLGLMAGIAPARLALRTRPIEAMGIRE